MTLSTAHYKTAKMANLKGRLALLLLLQIITNPLQAQPIRIVSVNLCTDALVLALLPKQRIAALSQYASDESRSPFADLAKNVPAVRVQAETILALKPDLVIAGQFGARETLKQLQRLNIPVEKFKPAENFTELAAQIVRMGNLLTEPERAAALVTQIQQLDNQVPPATLTIRGTLYLGSGFSPGRNTMEGRILELAGIENIAATPLRKGITAFSLEEFIVAKPEVLVLTDYHQNTPTRAQGFSHHPLLRRMQPHTVVLPAQLLTCAGGAWTTTAINRLREFTRQSHTVPEDL